MLGFRVCLQVFCIAGLTKRFTSPHLLFFPYDGQGVRTPKIFLKRRKKSRKCHLPLTFQTQRKKRHGCAWRHNKSACVSGGSQVGHILPTLGSGHRSGSILPANSAVLPGPWLPTPAPERAVAEHELKGYVVSICDKWRGKAGEGGRTLQWRQGSLPSLERRAQRGLHNPPLWLRHDSSHPGKRYTQNMHIWNPYTCC